MKLALYGTAVALALQVATSVLQGHHASAVALALACAVNVLAALRWRYAS